VLEPAKWSLDNCKAEMGAMGAAFLTPQPAQETATAHRMDATAEQANVGTMSRDTKDCLESAFGFAGQYIGQPGGSITMSNDFTGAASTRKCSRSSSRTTRATGRSSRSRMCGTTSRPGSCRKGSTPTTVLRQNAPAPTTDSNGDPLPDANPPGGVRPKKVTVRDKAGNVTQTLETD
jgi:hypothetical protein